MVGLNAGQSLYDAQLNVCVGNLAGANLHNRATNVLIGEEADNALKDGSDNTFVGFQAGLSSKDGRHNAFFGDNAGVATTTIGPDIGESNTFIGAHSLEANTTGSNNTGLGYATGNGNYTGSENLFLGHAASVSASNLTDASAIGSKTIATTSSTMILGNQDINVGIGFSNVPGGPLAKLHVYRQYGASSTFIPNPTAAKIDNDDVDNNIPFAGNAYGISVTTTGQNRANFGDWYKAKNANNNEAGYFEALGTQLGSSNFSNTAGHFLAGNGYQNFGIQSAAVNGTVSTAGDFRAGYAQGNVGVAGWAIAGPATATNFGVYESATPLPGTVFNVAFMA